MSDLVRATNKAESVKCVVLSVGTNDVCRGGDVKTIVSQYSTLLHEARQCFPNAAIAFTAIPPQSKPGKNKLSRAVNTRLGELCEQ